MNRYEAFCPITAEPFRNNNIYTEVLPCKELRPYIRCFWGTRAPVSTFSEVSSLYGIVTPDVCMDVIFTVDVSGYQIENLFCGINDIFFQSQAPDMKKFFIFALRFYPWAAILFSQEDFKETKNQFYDTGVHFEKLKKKLELLLLEQHSFQERILAAEKYLLELLNPRREDSLLMRAVDKMIESQGNLKILELATDLHISSRQMERIFHKNTGCTPKKLAELIRYQYLWQEICFNPDFQILDAVQQFGYTDQAHLLRDFRNIHGMTLKQARDYAVGKNERMMSKIYKNFPESSGILSDRRI